MGMGIFSLWCLLRRGLGMVDAAGYVGTRVSFPFRVAIGKVLAHTRLDFVRPVRRIFGPNRTRDLIGRSITGALDSLSPISSEPKLESPSPRRRALRSCGDVALASTQLRTVPSFHPCARRIWPRTLHRQ